MGCFHSLSYALTSFWAVKAHMREILGEMIICVLFVPTVRREAATPLVSMVFDVSASVFIQFSHCHSLLFSVSRLFAVVSSENGSEEVCEFYTNLWQNGALLFFVKFKSLCLFLHKTEFCPLWFFFFSIVWEESQNFKILQLQSVGHHIVVLAWQVRLTYSMESVWSFLVRAQHKRPD